MYTAAPINILGALLLPPAYMVGVIGLANYIYKRFVVGTKGEEYEDKRSMITAGASAVSKLVNNTVKGLYDTTYAIGTTLGNYFKSPSSSPAKPAEPHGGP